MRLIPTCCAIVLASVVTAAAQAPEPAVQFTGFNAFGTGNYSVGWTFTANQPIEVSSLGYFDFQNNGLAGAHAVGIWNSSGVLLTSAVVPAGTAAPLGSDGFRYVAIPTLLLPAGTYTIGGQSNASDLFWADTQNFTASSLITYGIAHYSESTTLVLPTIPRPDTKKSYFGPSMLIASAPLDSPPTASAGADFNVDEGQTGVTLDGSASLDPDGDALVYSWVQLPGGVAVVLTGDSTAHPSFTAPNVALGGQTLSFELTVSANGRTDTDIVSVTVVNVNHTPVADAGADQLVAEGAPVTLHGEGSFDPDGDDAQPTFTYSWVQVGGAPVVSLTGANTKTPTFTAPFAGAGGSPGVVATLVFELRVDDGFPADAPAPGFTFEHVADRVEITVTNVNNRPVADAGDDQTVDENGNVTLTAGNSSDPDGDQLLYSWTQIGGPPVSLQNASSASPGFVAPFTSPGGADLTFEVSIDDGYGGGAFDTVTVHVQNVNDPPLATAARPTVWQLWPPNHGLVSVGIVGVSDPDNNATIVITGVTQDEPTQGLGDGDTPVDAIINADGTVLLRAERAGTRNGRVYRISFTASDLEGSASGSVVVTVPHSLKKPAVDDGQNFDATH